jgi:oligoribonuclease (3'-5' exoribonuclease)
MAAYLYNLASGFVKGIQEYSKNKPTHDRIKDLTKLVNDGNSLKEKGEIVNSKTIQTINSMYKELAKETEGKPAFAAEMKQLSTKVSQLNSSKLKTYAKYTAVAVAIIAGVAVCVNNFFIGYGLQITGSAK